MKIDLSLLYFDFVLANYSNKNPRFRIFLWAHNKRGGEEKKIESRTIIVDSTWSTSRLYICSFSVLTVREVCPFVLLETGMRPPPHCMHHRRFGLL